MRSYPRIDWANMIRPTNERITLAYTNPHSHRFLCFQGGGIEPHWYKLCDVDRVESYTQSTESFEVLSHRVRPLGFSSCSSHIQVTLRCSTSSMAAILSVAITCRYWAFQLSVYRLPCGQLRATNPTVQLPTNRSSPCEFKPLPILRRVRTIKPFILSQYPEASLRFTFIISLMDAWTGIEPVTNWLNINCSTYWAISL